MDRLPVEVFAAATLGALLGALFVMLQGPGGNLMTSTLVGDLFFGGLGIVHWMKRLGSRGEELLR